MSNVTRRLAELEASTRKVSSGPRRIIMVDEIMEPGNVAQRLEDARREAGMNGLVVHVRCTVRPAL